MYSWVVLSFVLAGAKGGFADLASEKQGPYNIMIRIIEDCSEGDDVKIKFFPKMQRMDRKTLYVNGAMVLKIPIDNKVKFTIELSQKTAQGYKEKFFFTDFKGSDVCTVLTEYGDEAAVSRLFGAFNTQNKNYTGCPIEEGSHEFKIDVLVEPFKKVPIFFYNTYRTYLRLYEDLAGPSDGCLMLICDFIPKLINKRKG